MFTTAYIKSMFDNKRMVLAFIAGIVVLIAAVVAAKGRGGGGKAAAPRAAPPLEGSTLPSSLAEKACARCSDAAPDVHAFKPVLSATSADAYEETMEKTKEQNCMNLEAIIPPVGDFAPAGDGSSYAAFQ